MRVVNLLLWNLPRDGPLLKLAGVVLEKLGRQPLVERLAHQFGKLS